VISENPLQFDINNTCNLNVKYRASRKKIDSVIFVLIKRKVILIGPNVRKVYNKYKKIRQK